MRRSWWSRCFAVVLAVWFAFLVAEPMAVMHQCPMHDGVLAMHQMSGMAMPDMSATDHAQPVPGSHAPAHDPAHHQCTCVGDCAGAAAVGLPSQHTALILAVETAAMRDSGLPDHQYVPVWTQYVLPFQNGPPRA